MGKRRKKNYYKGPDITEKYNFFENQKIITKISDYDNNGVGRGCLLYTSPSPRDGLLSRMPSSA